MEWLGQAEYIKTQNETVDDAVDKAVDFFKSHGYYSKILKGQGLARLYPMPELRTSGDIDVLVGDCNPTEDFISEICKLAIENKTPKLHATYHHCDFGKISDTEVEAHWRASWFYTPWYNKRFQMFCQEHISDSDDIFPSLAFNRVYVLVHIYRHLFFEGIGLRQLLDYYMVLKASTQSTFWTREKIETMEQLKEFGMERFTSAVMWIMTECFGLNNDALLCTPNAQDGRFLLREVMTAGNFGHSDDRGVRKKGETYLGYKTRRIFRNFQYLRFGVAEMLWTPFWRLWHMCWWMPRHRI